MHRDISESAIMSTKANIGEEDIIALLVSKNKNKTKLDKIALYFQKKLPKNYNPRYWSYVNSFPRTPTFRIDKKLININSLKLYDFFKKKFIFLKKK
jgi:crotonobetaine/carnitine-CoA ligase